LILGNMPAMSVALGSQRFGVTSGGTIITGTSPVPTAVSGTGSASPIVTSTYQPTTYMNYFIKL
jgi:hypothetical protein